jgi:hypothetical protein
MSRSRGGTDPVEAAFADLAATGPSADLPERIRLGVAGTRQRRRTQPALRFLAVAAGFVVVIGAVALGGGWGQPRPTISPSSLPAVSASRAATPASSPSASPAVSNLSPGAIARATTDLSIGLGVTVRAGQTVLILSGATDRSGVSSYQVQYFGDLDTGYRPNGASGWIPAADVARLLAEVAPACPGDPTLASVSALQPFERPACFGSGDLTFEPVAARQRSYGAPLSDRWISTDGKPDFLTGLPVYGLTPDLAPDVVLPDEGWYRVTGHFDDPSSLACGDDVKVAVCRERFVITAVAAAEAPSFVVRGRWTPMATAPIDGRTAHALVWTGSEMLVWGGTGSSPTQSVFDSVYPRGGAAYDPVHDRWRRIPDAPIPGRDHPIAVWTGRELVVFGGYRGGNATTRLDGAAYDPATNHWRTIARSPLSGTGTLGGWLNGRMIVVTATSAAAYDPDADRWTTLPAPPLHARWASAAVAAGRLTIVDFGDGATPPVRWETFDGASATWTSGEAPVDPLAAGITIGATDERVVFPETGDELDPTTGRWSRTFRCEGAGAAPVWTGSVLIAVTTVWDRRTGECRDLPPAPPRAKPFDDTNGREFPVAIWTGTQYLTWSGGTGGDIAWVPNDGAIFTPVDDIGPCCG